QHPHGVLGLRLRDGGDLDPRARVALPYRLAVLIPVGETRRAAELDQREAGQERVLAPPLHALKDAGLVDEPATLVDGEPMQNEPHLLVREAPGLALVVAEVASAPADDLPAESLVRQQPGAVLLALPGGSDEHRGERALVKLQSLQPLPLFGGQRLGLQAPSRFLASSMAMTSADASGSLGSWSSMRTFSRSTSVTARRARPLMTVSSLTADPPLGILGANSGWNPCSLRSSGSSSCQ